MEDLFYFTRAQVPLAAIETIAVTAGYPCSYFQGVGLLLRIHQTGSHWEFSEWYDPEALEPPDRQRLEQYAPVSCFLISFHVPSLPALARLLKAVLDAYSGWVAGDDDWEQVYNCDTIIEIRLPYLERPSHLRGAL